MKEKLLHYLWQVKRFDLKDLKTTGGESIQIIDFGVHNTDAGPDFQHARIRIGQTLWAGNVEMHVLASDWIKHLHQEDKAYNNVILHVVLEEDQTIARNNGELIPCLELRHRIPAGIEKQYAKLLQNTNWIPCHHLFAGVPEVKRNLWLDRLTVERLEEKTRYLQLVLHRTRTDWEESFYQILARSFGVKVNADAAEQLARSLPLRILRSHRQNLFQVEALFFGQAGILEGTFNDDYPKRLKKEYLFLQKKYGLQSMKREQWKLLRLRPANFPTLRIAQFSSLMFSNTHLFAKILSALNVKEIEHLFDLKLSLYWHDHYVFDKHSPRRPKRLGQQTIHHIIINTIIPFLFLYGKERDNKACLDKALAFLEALKAENNRIISGWEAVGAIPVNAGQSQALIQLKNNYCDQKRCLHCTIGDQILGGKKLI